MAIKAIVFDLGGVLVELEGQPIKNEWMSSAESFEDNWRRWLSSPLSQAFERGEIEIDEFAEGLIDEMQLKVGKAQFIDEFTRWPKAFFEGVFDLMQALEPLTLGVFSNITAVHWPRYYPDLFSSGCFTHLFASYQLGLAKPDPNAYKAIATKMGLACNEVLFFDDNQVNVDGARSVGMQAELTVGLKGVYTALEQHQLLPRQ
ncbi:MAG: HAD superfamily hydrolase (TIGR01509 family) [Gammaproteobacteria bacterium]|jgi:HAD superfamily hydrolase (TIGR01509 family)